MSASVLIGSSRLLPSPGVRRRVAGRSNLVAGVSRAAVVSLVVHLLVVGGLTVWFQGDDHNVAPPAMYSAVLLSAPADQKVRPPQAPAQTVAESAVLFTPASSNPSEQKQEPVAREAEAQTQRPVSRPELPPAPAYKVRAALERGPVPLFDVEPSYPKEAGGVQGTVTLRLLINESGVVDDAAVVSASPPGLFEASALDAFRRAAFAPGQLLGFAVKSQLTIEVRFQSFNKGAIAAR